MTRRYDMGNLWALYADGHRGYCLEFENVGPLFEHARDVNYLDLKDMVSRGPILFNHSLRALRARLVLPHLAQRQL